MSDFKTIAGAGLAGGGVANGFTGWLADNAAYVSLTMTALTSICGIVFLYLGHIEKIRMREERHRANDISQRQLDLQIERDAREAGRRSSDA